MARKEAASLSNRVAMDRNCLSFPMFQEGNCGICGEKFTDYSDVVPDHISPRGWWCNGEKGSSRV